MKSYIYIYITKIYIVLLTILYIATVATRMMIMLLMTMITEATSSRDGHVKQISSGGVAGRIMGPRGSRGFWADHVRSPKWWKMMENDGKSMNIGNMLKFWKSMSDGKCSKHHISNAKSRETHDGKTTQIVRNTECSRRKRGQYPTYAKSARHHMS